MGLVARRNAQEAEIYRQKQSHKALRHKADPVLRGIVEMTNVGPFIFCCYQGRLSARHPPCQQSGWEPQQGTAVLGDRSTPSPSGTTAARRATAISTN